MNDTTTNTTPILPTKAESESPKGARFEVYSINPQRNGASIWVRAGSAFINRDGSLNIYLDVLPINGRLHVRPAPKKLGDEN